MKIIFIKPNMIQGIPADSMEPRVFGILSALTPPDIERCLYDDRFEPVPPYDNTADLVAITVDTFSARRAYEIADAYRSRGVPVVLGGFHPSLCPDEAQEYADAVVVGDAEAVWADVVEDAAAGRLKPRYHGTANGPPQAGSLLPRRDLFEGKGYLPITLMQFGRGCRNACDYCAIGAFSKRGYACRPVADVVRDIQAQNRKLVFFVDDNITALPAAAKELFRAMIPLKIKWVSQGTTGMTDDSELMQLMKQSGCLGHVIGFETLDPANLLLSGKPNKLDPAAAYRKH